MRTASPADASIIRGDGTYLVTGGLTGLGLLIGAVAGRARRETRGPGRTTHAIGRGAVGDCGDGAARRRRDGCCGRRRGPHGARHAARRRTRSVAAAQGHRPRRRRALRRRVATTDLDKFDEVFRPKVVGTALLDELTRGDALDFFVLYSSVAGVFGSPGQSNHAAASAYEDAFVASRRAAGLPAASIGWGAWSEIGAAVTHRVLDRAERRGMEAIHAGAGARGAGSHPPQWPRARRRGADRLDPVHHAGGCRARTVLFGLREGGRAAGGEGWRARRPPTSCRRWSRPHRLAGASCCSTTCARRRCRCSASTDRRPSTIAKRCTSADLDSLMAVELRNVLGRSLGCTLPATLLFDYTDARRADRRTSRR